jgi:hypothetical protein
VVDDRGSRGNLFDGRLYLFVVIPAEDLQEALEALKTELREGGYQWLLTFVDIQVEEAEALKALREPASEDRTPPKDKNRPPPHLVESIDQIESDLERQLTLLLLGLYTFRVLPFSWVEHAERTLTSDSDSGIAQTTLRSMIPDGIRSTEVQVMEQAVVALSRYLERETRDPTVRSILQKWIPSAT